ncbi:ARM repeat-containing protein [Pleomassaria siparia CBS 279.74]|uniref:ARM repeat-containing protein n=1 Tax=Pleomassaria siparia CBS 279.74 TaxID=1314801 RepID=A0A6G1KH82_9PLEO|nr:ARM repeat-containing protein [Pleomassaria siparia CBS 279.74]
MPHFSSDSAEFLSELESYLNRGPEEQCSELQEIPVRLSKLENDGELEIAEKTVQLLGTAVGQQKKWQIPFQSSGVLSLVTQQLNPDKVPIVLCKQYLRVIGNCVADNDSNRQVVLDHFPSIVTCLGKEELDFTAFAVLLNLCTDFEPAQIQAATLRLDSTIVNLLATDNIPKEAIDYATDLLAWTTEKLTPVQMKDNTSIGIFDKILDLSLQYDEDHYHEYVAILVYYLQDTELQQTVATPETLEKLLDLMFDFESRLTQEEVQGVFRSLSVQIDPAKITSEETSTLLVLQLINSISSISASDTFAKNFSVSSSVVKKVRSKLLSLSMSPSTVCACVILGNLAISDAVSIDMVEDMGLHLTLLGLLSSRREPALLFAAAGFMRHLVFPEANRTALGEAGLIEACCSLLTNKDPSVRGEAAAILCKLVSNNFQNIEKVVYEAMPDDIQPAKHTGVELPPHPTILYHIVSQALIPTTPLPSTSMKNAMIEIGRTIIAILRYLGQANAEQDVEPVARHMFKTPLVARPVARLARQRLFAEARSEGLLGLGLMAQSHEGAMAVIEELKADNALLETIKDFATSPAEEGQQVGSSLGRDHQNALVLLHGLAANGVNAMDPSMRHDVDSLREELSRLLL